MRQGELGDKGQFNEKGEEGGDYRFYVAYKELLFPPPSHQEKKTGGNKTGKE